MRVMLDTDERVTIVCDRVELDLLDNGLSVMVSEYDFGRPEPWIDLAKQMMTDIANMEMM
jgi:hypothetical protein